VIASSMDRHRVHPLTSAVGGRGSGREHAGHSTWRQPVLNLAHVGGGISVDRQHVLVVA
jgi:hypothetical protein